MGHTLSVTVTGSADGYLPVDLTSAETVAVPAVVLPSVTAGSVSIVGAVEVGATLTAVTSGWLPAGVVFSYQWLVDGAPIGGATAGTYVPVAGDVGHTLSVTVTGSADGYLPVDLTSAETVAVPAVVLPSVTAGSVSIVGAVEVGATLTAVTSGWLPAGVVFSYQWLVDGAPIGGATAGTYVPVAGDVGHTLSVTVTGSADGYLPVDLTSAETAAVIVPVVPSVTAGTPTITGTAAVSGTLVAQPGSWTPAGVVFSYQWSTEGGPISGATSSSYVPTTADVGHRLTVAVTGSKDGYAPATVASAATAAVQSSTSVLAYEAFVKASYVDFLGRVPSAGEVAFQATALSEGRVTKAQYLASLSTSNEWLTAIVTKMYRDTLNRDPGPQWPCRLGVVVEVRSVHGCRGSEPFLLVERVLHGHCGGLDIDVGDAAVPEAAEPNS